jgi:hypothetical protein
VDLGFSLRLRHFTALRRLKSAPLYFRN